MTRPRDRLGRPVSADSDDVVPSAPVIDDLTDERAWSIATDYLDDGLPFHAHEVFEQRWREAPAESREAWRALAQWGAALTHAARGNSTGAREVARRALVNLDASATPACVDVERVRASCRQLIDA